MEVNCCRRSSCYNFDWRQRNIVVEMRRSKKAVRTLASRDQLRWGQSWESNALNSALHSYRSAGPCSSILRPRPTNKFLVILNALFWFQVQILFFPQVGVMQRVQRKVRKNWLSSFHSKSKKRIQICSPMIFVREKEIEYEPNQQARIFVRNSNILL